MRMNIYIDGFNTYYGCLKGTPHKWLDVAALCSRLFPRDEINRIRYFTARVGARPPDLGQPQRQQTYLRALATITGLSIHYGHFLTNTCRMPLANPTPGGPATVEVVKTEEKGSDVNLATYLLVDAFNRDCEVAVVISNDSDLKEPVDIAQSAFGISVGVVNPHPANRRSRALRPTFFKQIRASTLAACQFAGTLTDANGSFTKPASW